MAYEPLHHKYRPQTFAELVGQEAIATTLINALRQQKIAPAYLFTGARGTGKTSSARILAKSLNCLQADRPTEKPCGVCEVCRSIANGSALDVIEIDAASNTGVDNIRELIERSQFAPVQCRYKVYVVDECHMLSTAAFNALLKTLEEPPDRVIFVLATTDPQRVLPTIISRCQRFDFRRIELSAMVRHLGQIATQEAIEITPEAIQLVAQIAQGGLRDAESMLDQLSLLEGRISVERVWDLVGAVPERDLLALMQAIVQNDTTAVIDRVRHLMDRGREPLIVLQNLASFYRDLLIAKTTPDRMDLVAITAPTWAEMVNLVQAIEVSTLLQGQQHLRASEVQIKNSTQPRLWLEVTLLGLLSIAATPASATPQTNTGPVFHSTPAKPSQAIAPVSASAPLPVPVPAPSPITTSTPLPSPALEPPIELPPEPTPVSLNGKESPSVPSPPVSAKPALNLEQIWQSILDLLQPPGTQALFKQQGCLLSLEGGMARIGISSQPLFKMAQQRVSNLEVAFEKYVNHPVKVSLEVVAAPVAQSPTTSAPTPASAPPSMPAPALENPVSIAPTLTEPMRANRPLETLSSGPDTASAIEPTVATNGRIVSEPAAPYPASQPTPDPTAESLLSQAWQTEDEVSRAAKSLAQMFNGQVVSLEGGASTGNLGELEFDRTVSELSSDLVEDGDPDDDVPF